MVADTLTKVFPNIKAKQFAFTLGLQLTWRGSVGIFKVDYTDRKVRVSFYGIQVCSYILPTRHWTWRNITIVLFMSIFVTITLHALTYYTYLFTITIVTYLVLSFILSIDQHLSGTNNYLLIYFIYILQNKLSYYSISSTGFPWKFWILGAVGTKQCSKLDKKWSWAMVCQTLHLPFHVTSEALFCICAHQYVEFWSKHFWSML